MHRFYVKPDELQDKSVIIKGEEFKHLAYVLRLKPGDHVSLFDGEGREYQGIIEYLTKDKAGISYEEQMEYSAESPLNLYLVQGLAKGDKMEFIIQKATELGVRGIIPLEAERSIIRLAGDKKEVRRQRWQKVALEAAKQCRRAYVPTVAAPQKMLEFLQTHATADSLLLIPWEEGGQSLKAVLTDPERGDLKKKSIYVLIGPEGGWDKGEVDSATGYGAIAVTLGPRILRTETAGLTVISSIMYQWGDLG